MNSLVALPKANLNRRRRKGSFKSSRNRREPRRFISTQFSHHFTPKEEQTSHGKVEAPGSAGRSATVGSRSHGFFEGFLVPQGTKSSITTCGVRFLFEKRQWKGRTQTPQGCVRERFRMLKELKRTKIETKEQVTIPVERKADEEIRSHPLHFLLSKLSQMKFLGPQ